MNNLNPIREHRDRGVLCSKMLGKLCSNQKMNQSDSKEMGRVEVHKARFSARAHR